MNPEYKALLESYQDRKKLKWLGFFLSDHTSQINNERKAREYRIPQKPKMTLEEIDRVLYYAKLKNLPVAIQKDEMSLEGFYDNDIVGKLKGFDDLGIYVGQEKIDYDNIRNAELTKDVKWSEL